ncbi:MULTISPECIES: hypothetical protein [Bacillus cereus group]|uniref:Cardiolipin synthase n=1 Tax=Bacillus thuringiensis TaxID=1428 RepID=A0A1C4F7X9_BACTU|nr:MULTISPECIES: hypothetical protein [Bacillus cereus group]MED3025588.1 hypothetical protein [Bacillus wiedmannii]OTY00471.1 hypothetical protein BK729_09420 [Bacillus thuringiensis serovar wratislaviensis]OUB61966.1 hypothetical protein BK743_07555 [Bacillus thuringiensis serovar sylvestriensis]SCC51926.1 Uncharacterized protein BTT61001_04019 [Bacillus thuringiensis]
MYKHKVMKWFLCLLIFSFLIVISKTFWSNTDTVETSNVPSNSETIILSKTFKTTNHLSEMVEEADLIVLGEYGGLHSKWNMVNNSLHEIQGEDVEGHLFNFYVKEILKGYSVENKILINHRYSETLVLEESNEVTDDNGIILKGATKVFTKKVENKDPLYIEPKSGETYIVFLKENSKLGHFYPALEPFMIQFDIRGVAHLKSNLIDWDKNKDKYKYEAKVKEKIFYIENEIDSTIKDNVSGKKLKDIKDFVKRTSTIK